MVPISGDGILVCRASALSITSTQEFMLLLASHCNITNHPYTASSLLQLQVAATSNLA
jgi:hypothetical protein